MFTVRTALRESNLIKIAKAVFEKIAIPRTRCMGGTCSKRDIKKQKKKNQLWKLRKNHL